jgi:translation initiation factor IF-2
VASASPAAAPQAPQRPAPHTPPPQMPSHVTQHGPTPPAAVIAPGRPIPSAPKPLPGTGPGTPRPGQILSGPRQPFPAASEGVRPGPGTAQPAPQRPNLIPRQRPEGPREGSREGYRPSPSGSAPSAPQSASSAAYAPSQSQSRTLAGQPAARPVVPPRPDLAAKLGVPRPSMPGGAGGARAGRPPPLQAGQTGGPSSGNPEACHQRASSRATYLSWTDSPRPAPGSQTGSASRTPQHGSSASRWAEATASHLSRQDGARSGAAACGCASRASRR